jgi:hypothetical protein
MSAIVEQPDLNTMEEILPKDQLLLPVTEAYSKEVHICPEYFVTFGKKLICLQSLLGIPIIPTPPQLSLLRLDRPKTSNMALYFPSQTV